MKNKKAYQNVIGVCMGKNCRGNGADEIYKIFRKSIKNDPQEKRTLLIKMKCLDLCKKGPVVIKNKQLFTRVIMEDIL